MVWNSAGSALYKTVERHNAEAYAPPTDSYDPPPRNRSDTPQQDRSAPAHSHIPTASPLQRITQDRDIMLIAAIILILLHEKADMKLVLALAFVIFS